MTTAYASNQKQNYMSMDNESLAKLIGTDAQDVAYLKETYAERFNQVVYEYLSNTSAPDYNQLPLEQNPNAVRIDEIN